MATHRKLGIGFGALFAVAAFLTLFTGNASALTPTPAQARAAGPFEWIDSQRIKATINNQEVFFTFQQSFPRAPSDAGNLGGAFVANDVTCGSNRAYIRPGSASGDEGTRAVAESRLFISAQAGSGGNCDWIQRQVNVQDQAFRSSIVKWIDEGTIQTIGQVGGIPNATNFIQRGGTGNFFRQGETECIDQVVVSGARATVYELKVGPDQAPANEIGLPQFGNCEVLSINGVTIDSREEGRNLARQTIAIALPANSRLPAGSGGAGEGAEVGEPSCESENNTGLEWMICPILVGIDGAVNGINNIILDQLEFNPDQDLGNAVDGSDGTRDNNGVKLTWNIIKNISTFLIIIIMLVMVLSTAISWGPFDAYTVRQVLPRLVIAIIAMQLSWEFLIFIIELTNDVGRGLADLMYAPFGGAQNMTLSALIGGGTSEAAATSIFATAVIAAGIGAAISPFGVLVLAISAIASIFIGIVVLLIRNILIILCLMIAPLAILMWVLPGTRNYWNFWQETFGKLMLMFPFIVALLASGRIFAHITGTATTGDTGGGLINFIAAIVGVFGPFWLLPKTLQWGGRAFGNLTGVLQNSKTKGLFDRSKNWANKQGEARKAWKTRDASKRLASGEYSKTRKALGFQAWDRYTTGTSPVTKANRMKAKQLAGTYENLLSDETKLERARLDRDLNLLSGEKRQGESYSDQEKYRRAVLLGTQETLSGLDGSTITVDGKNASEAVRRAVAENALTFSDFGSIESYLQNADRSKNRALIEEANRFRNGNAGDLNKLTPHLLVPSAGADTTPGFSFSAGKSAAQIAEQKPYEAKAVLQHYVDRISELSQDPARAEDYAKAQREFGTFLANHAAATTGEQTRDTISTGSVEAVKAFVEGQRKDAAGNAINPEAILRPEDLQVLEGARRAYSTRNDNGTMKIPGGTT